MGRLRHSLVGWVIGPLRHGMARVGRSSASATTASGRLLWRQRLHWPAVLLGGAVLTACIAGPALTTPATVSASQPGSTLPASAWPDLLHQGSAAPALAASPANLVPACATGQPSAREPAFSAGPADAVLGGSRVVLASLLAPTPMVTGVSPSSGPVTGGTRVEISGSGFTGATAVLFGVVPAAFAVVSDSEITATTVAGLGAVDVKVITLGGPSAATGADRFSFVAPALPSLPSLPGLPGAPGVNSNPVTGSGGSGTGGSSSGSGGSGGATSTLTPGTTTTTTPATTLAPALGGGVIPNGGFGFSDGYLGCSLIDSQTGNPAAGETPQQDRAVRLALSLIGTPYVWGGESTHGFDCSGLVQFVYSASGIELPRVAQAQYDAGPAVAPGQTVVPGDLVFFGTGSTRVSHVGIFVGNGVMV
ncbi:MAG: NlpC/P60 family protein, partial [Acidimicrobiales bacterium]